MGSKKTFSSFRKVAFYEGISFLVLLFIAMPMKYIWGIPMAVRVIGSIHGALFIAFVVYMYMVYNDYEKNTKWMAKAFLASIIPFGTIVMDKQWKLEEQTA